MKRRRVASVKGMLSLSRKTTWSEEGVPLSEAEKNYPSIMCIEEDCDEVFAGEQEMKQHKDKNHSGPNKFFLLWIKRFLS